ncbi:MAG TPA: MarR family transcriptional regulator [Burkholderiaceae bacterium]
MFDHCMYFNTTALARALEKEWTLAFAPFGLTPSQGFLLRVVLAKPGSLQSQLAHEMAIARPTATRTLDGLEKLHLIERRASAHDRRELSIHPTARAKALHAELNAASAAVTQRLKRVLTAPGFDDTVEKVKLVRAALG